MSRALIDLFGGALIGLSAVAAPISDTTLIDVGSHERFGSYEDNFVLANRMHNNGWADNDETALRAHYSFRYVFFGRRTYEIFASYTGEFDFYMGTRPSGPVINRISNPALRLSWQASSLIPDARTEDHFEVGLEHRSNGQVVEITSAQDAEAAQRAYDNRDRPYFDQISRGSNFVSLAAKLSKDTVGLPFSLCVKVRIYLNQDSVVTWGPLVGQDVRVADYDRLSLRLARQTPLGEFEGQWTVGDKGLKTDSLELGWQAPENWWFPVYVRMHRGPMNTLSNYTQRQDSVGVGLRFASF